MANPNPIPALENLRPFPPGTSGNPQGYSARRRVTDALVKIIAEKGAEKGLAVTWLAMALGDSDALKGRTPDFRFFQELLNRIEGKVIEQVEITQNPKGYKGESPDTLWTDDDEPTSLTGPPSDSGETPDPNSSSLAPPEPENPEHV